MNNLEEFEKILGIRFKNKELIKTALTHRSYLNEHPEISQENNERLEFLGDSVLEILISEHLYKEYKKPEGEMTNIRAALVNSNSLSKIAKELKIEKFLFLSRGEANDSERAKASLLANALEAIIGAVYLDQDIDVARDFITKHILKILPAVLGEESVKDPKSLFQEIAQERYGITPDYEVLKEWGPDHKREFLMGAYLNKRLIAKGEGFSKKEATEKAAGNALKIIRTNEIKL